MAGAGTASGDRLPSRSVERDRSSTDSHIGRIHPRPVMAGSDAKPSRSTKIGVLVFDDVEELDFVGPWEVFSVANRIRPGSFPARLRSTGPSTIRARFGMLVTSASSVYHGRSPDLLILPGGPGRKRESRDARLLEYLRRAHQRGTVLASVCTGAFILAAAGLLDGKTATTHHAALAELQTYSKVKVVRRRIVDEGDILTAGGISAGIDLGLHLVRRFAGGRVATEVAKTMEYVPFRR